MRRQWETGIDIALIYAGAVASKPEIRNELEPRLAARERIIETVSQMLRPALAQGLTPTDATAIISALTLPEVYRELVQDRGWTPDAFQIWLEHTLTNQLLAVAGGHKSRCGRGSQRCRSSSRRADDLTGGLPNSPLPPRPRGHRLSLGGVDAHHHALERVAHA